MIKKLNYFLVLLIIALICGLFYANLVAFRNFSPVTFALLSVPARWLDKVNTIHPEALSVASEVGLLYFVSIFLSVLALCTAVIGGFAYQGVMNRAKEEVIRAVDQEINNRKEEITNYVNSSCDKRVANEEFLKELLLSIESKKLSNEVHSIRKNINIDIE